MNPQCIEAADEWIGNEIRHLTELLRTERRMRGGMAFKCRDSACCNFGHWVCEGNCDCYHHQRVEHDAAVDRALGIRGANCV